jgi:predicted lipopolysaccharide heptosyltransferase III
VKNILVIKLRYLGDVLLATPVLRALREAYPEARLTALVNEGTEDVLRWNVDLNDLLVVRRRGIRAGLVFLADIRRRQYDCVIDLTDGDRSALIARWSGASVRIGFNEEHRWRGLLYTTALTVPPGMHRIERDLQALRALGLDPKATTPVLRTTPQDDEKAETLLHGFGITSGGRPLVMMQPGARYWFKAWPPERFAELADRLTERFGCRVLLGGDVREVPLAEQICSLARSSPVVLAGRTTLLQYAAVLRRCALFVGNDNGPMHMAAAVGIPVVAVFGPSDPAEWGPRGTRSEVLYKGLDCRRCFHPTCERGELNCMKQISVDEVYAAAQCCLI